MSRLTLIVTITVDVDDPMAVHASAMDKDGVPSLEDAIGSVVVDVIAERAVPALNEHGIHAVTIGHSSADWRP